MGQSRIPDQYLATKVDFKPLVTAYNKSVAGRLIREACVKFVTLEGWDALKSFATAVLAAIPTKNPTKMDATGTLTMQTPRVGVVVGVVPSHWDGIPKPTFTYQWKKDGSSISLATASAYTPVSGDSTHTLSCLITATNTGGSATETIAAANATIPA